MPTLDTRPDAASRYQSGAIARLDAATPLDTDLPPLTRYLRIALRWKWVIAAIVFGCMILGLILTLLVTPKYTAVATLEISRQQDKVVNVQDVRPENSVVDQEFYLTQYSLLQARSLAERVTAELGLANSDIFATQMGSPPKDAGLLSTQTKISPEQIKQKRARRSVDLLLGNIGIEPIRGSRLVRVSFRSPDPQLSAKIANAWTKIFIDSNLARRFESTSYARTFLEGRLALLRQKLEESERQLVGYAAAERIINIPGGATGTDERSERPIVAEDLAALNAALTEATAERVKTQSRVGSAPAGANIEALSNPAISQLRQKRSEAAAEYARLMIQFEPGYPAARAVATQIAELDRAIAREESRVTSSFRTAYNEALTRESDLKARVDRLKDDLLDLRRRSIQYNIYQRDVDTNRQLYDGLLQRYKEIGVSGGVGTNNVAVVDSAEVPVTPSSPRLAYNLLLALIIGIALAGGVAFALEQVDENINDPSDVIRATGLPLLGAIPNVAEGSVFDLLQDRKSSVSEAYLSLQTNLGFSSDHGIPRSIAVTSTRPAEGKSTSSYAIAQLLARTGRRAIIVDCDMRSPSVHRLLGIANTRGTSNFLAGDDGLAALIVNLDSFGLSALPAGPQPPNAAELLTGQRLTLLIERLLETFDHVVIDAPPVVGLADAPLISNCVEGVVFAVEARGARGSMIRTAVARLQAANTRLLGVVLTKFDAKRAHYGYGYDYGYGYGKRDEGADSV